MNSNHSSSPKNEFTTGWKILALSLIGIITSAGVVPLYSFGVFVGDLSLLLDRPPGELQLCITFFFVGLAVGSQLAGWLISRYGIRLISISSLIALSFVYALTALLPLTIWKLYFLYFAFPVIGCGTLQITWSQLTCHWFEKNRGIALAIVFSGTGISSILLPIILTLSKSAITWQWGYLVLALLPVITLGLCLTWLHEPQSVNQDNKLVEEQYLIPGFTFSQAIRTSNFWIICTALILVVSGVLAMVTNLIPLLMHKGMTSVSSAGVYSAFGAALIVGRMIVGFLLDRIHVITVAFTSLFIPAIGCFILWTQPSDSHFMILGAVFIGVGAGAEYDIAAYIITRYFGLREYAKIFGTQMGVTTASVCLAPIFFGYLIDYYNGYDQLLICCMIFFIAGSALFLLLGPYPQLKFTLKELDT